MFLAVLGCEKITRYENRVKVSVVVRENTVWGRYDLKILLEIRSQKDILFDVTVFVGVMN